VFPREVVVAAIGRDRSERSARERKGVVPGEGRTTVPASPGREQEVNIVTTRFGPLTVRTEEVILIPDGLVGFRDHTQYVLLPDSEVAALHWLQSLSDPALAFALVSPSLAVADYRVELRPGDRAAVGLADGEEPQVLVILNRAEQGLTVNLQGPLVLNTDRRLARQLVLTSSRYAVRYPLDHPVGTPSLAPGSVSLRATA
jgi:flagellar assembly factor FliW